jgi:hypothetical protein
VHRLAHRTLLAQPIEREQRRDEGREVVARVRVQHLARLAPRVRAGERLFDDLGGGQFPGREIADLDVVGLFIEVAHPRLVGRGLVAASCDHTADGAPPAAVVLQVQHDAGIGEVVVHHPAPEGEFERRGAHDAVDDERGVVHVGREVDGRAFAERGTHLRIERDLDVAVRIVAPDEARLAVEPGVDLGDDAVLAPRGRGGGGEIDEQRAGLVIEWRGAGVGLGRCFGCHAGSLAGNGGPPGRNDPEAAEGSALVGVRRVVVVLVDAASTDGPVGVVHPVVVLDDVDAA